MNNYVKDGKTVEFTAGAAYDSGDVVILGNLAGVVIDDVDSGDVGVARLYGVVKLAKATGVITLGQKLYWDSSAENVTTTAAGNTYIGCAFAAYASGDTIVKVQLSQNTQAFENECSWKTATAVSADDTAGYVDLDTNLGVVPSVFIVNVFRSNVVSGADAVVTALTGSDAGKIRVADGSSYKVTADDVINVFAGV